MWLTSLNAVICIWILFTKRHCITRLGKQTRTNQPWGWFSHQTSPLRRSFLKLLLPLTRDLYRYNAAAATVRCYVMLLTECIPSCCRWWPRCPLRRASGRAGESAGGMEQSGRVTDQKTPHAHSSKPHLLHTSPISLKWMLSNLITWVTGNNSCVHHCTLYCHYV